MPVLHLRYKGEVHDVLVDAADMPRMENRRWYIKRTPNTYYVTGFDTEQGSVFLHRFLLGLKRGDPHVDHRNGNGLDNRRQNLRIATVSQNNANRPKRRGSSQYKGVIWHTAANRWVAQISSEYLGTFDEERDAAIAYDNAARDRFGEFAQVNFPDLFEPTPPSGKRRFRELRTAVHALRNAGDRTQHDIARELGISKSRVSQILRER